MNATTKQRRTSSNRLDTKDICDNEALIGGAENDAEKDSPTPRTLNQKARTRLFRKIRLIRKYVFSVNRRNENPLRRTTSKQKTLAKTRRRSKAPGNDGEAEKRIRRDELYLIAAFGDPADNQGQSRQQKHQGANGRSRDPHPQPHPHLHPHPYPHRTSHQRSRHKEPNFSFLCSLDASTLFFLNLPNTNAQTGICARTTEKTPSRRITHLPRSITTKSGRRRRQ